MKILITGAGGFIAGRLASYLAEKNHDIVGLTRSIKKHRRKIKYPLFEWRDLSEPPPPEAFSNVQAVVNLAGASVASRWSQNRKTVLISSRVTYTEQLVSAMKKHPSINTLISASGVGFYGNRKEEILNEHSPQGIGFLPHLCSHWEKAAKAFCGDNKRVVIFRISNVLSKKGGMASRLAPLFKWGMGCRFADGRQWMSWIHIEDLLRLTAMALENPVLEGVFNAAAPGPVRHGHFVKIFKETLGRPVFMKAPAWLLKSMLGEMSCLLLDSTRAVPELSQKKGFVFEYSELESALKNLF